MSHEKDGKETLAAVEGESAAVLAYFGLFRFYVQAPEKMTRKPATSSWIWAMV
jgi:hypothetical protein